MTPGRARTLLAAALLTAAGCGGADDAPRAAGGDASADSGASTVAGAIPAGPAERPAAAPIRDPVPLNATLYVGDERFIYAGTGECTHAPDASIHGKPAAQWHVRFVPPTGDVSEALLTLWRPEGAPALQLSLAVQEGEEVHRIATVAGQETHGAGTARVAARGQGGTIEVDGKDERGRTLRLTVECPRFTYPVAEGG